MAGRMQFERGPERESVVGRTTIAALAAVILSIATAEAGCASKANTGSYQEPPCVSLGHPIPLEPNMTMAFDAATKWEASAYLERADVYVPLAGQDGDASTVYFGFFSLDQPGVAFQVRIASSSGVTTELVRGGQSPGAETAIDPAAEIVETEDALHSAVVAACASGLSSPVYDVTIDLLRDLRNPELRLIWRAAFGLTDGSTLYVDLDAATGEVLEIRD